MKQVVVICSQCMGGFEPDQITVVPRHNPSMSMVVTAHICGQCLDRVLDETEAYLRTARCGQPYMIGYGLKHNDVIEQFVGFLLRNNLFREAIEMRYAPSVDKGIERMMAILASTRGGSGPIKLPKVS